MNGGGMSGNRQSGPRPVPTGFLVFNTGATATVSLESTTSTSVFQSHRPSGNAGLEIRLASTALDRAPVAHGRSLLTRDAWLTMAWVSSAVGRVRVVSGSCRLSRESWLTMAWVSSALGRVQVVSGSCRWSREPWLVTASWLLMSWVVGFAWYNRVEKRAGADTSSSVVLGKM
jgi:hypothetical protein